MGLPVHACSDEELMHYAGVDEDAAKELARRSVEFRSTYLHEIESLQEEVNDLESQLETAGEDSGLADDLLAAINRVKDILKDWRHMEHGALMTATEEVLNELADF